MSNSTKRFKTRVIKIGKILVGGDNPIRIQSMTNTDTLDIEKTTTQIMNLSDNGCEIARIAVQGLSQAYACEKIKNNLLKKGYSIPLVADIHFFPKAAIVVSDFVDKIRINPGNYAEKRAIFSDNEITQKEYLKALNITEEKFLPLLEKLKKNKVALRIGVNHGSLSDRIMAKYGNTEKGMVESAVEYTNICRKYDFHSIVYSMKSSSAKVMINSYRLLASEMIKLGFDYPIHLGVTEAGCGMDGKIKSAIGIGSLLLDGIGDTIRVSLTDDPVNEIKPAKEIAKIAKKYKGIFKVSSHSKNNKNAIIAIDKNENIKDLENIDLQINPKDKSYLFIDSIDEFDKKYQNQKTIVFKTKFPITFKTREFFNYLLDKNIDAKLFLNTTTLKLDLENIAEIGSLFIDGLIDGVYIKNEQKDLFLNILQSCNKRNTKTEFISCPGCGRTLFDIHKAVKKLKKDIPNIKNLKVAIMGCIVNGPGEMQDADFGYVGAGKGMVDLYANKKCIKKNLDAKQGYIELLKLIEQMHGAQ